jgi:hypothetical protein
MPNEIILKLKSDLHVLNCHIQAERNDEVRHSLQRGRLEAERAQTLAKLMEAYTAAVSEQPVVEKASVSCISHRPNSPYSVTVGLRGSEEQTSRHRRKPDNIPPMSRMIAEVLRDSAAQGRAELAPAAIAAFIRAKWWPTVRTGDVNTQVWRLAQIGRLAKIGSLYRLNDPAMNGGVAH